MQVEYPNMSGLAPGAAAFFLTFNHDTERFEIVASGHVVDDGSKIISDPVLDLPSRVGAAIARPIRRAGVATPYLNISGLSLVENSKTITLTTTKSPIDWSFEPITAGASVSLEPHEDSVKVTGTAEGVVSIIARWKDPNSDNLLPRRNPGPHRSMWRRGGA